MLGQDAPHQPFIHSSPDRCLQLVSAAEAAAAEAAAAAAEEAAKGAAPSLGLFGLGTKSIIRKAEAEVRGQRRHGGPECAAGTFGRGGAGYTA